MKLTEKVIWIITITEAKKLIGRLQIKLQYKCALIMTKDVPYYTFVNSISRFPSLEKLIFVIILFSRFT
jgi:hypothetical protein